MPPDPPAIVPVQTQLQNKPVVSVTTQTSTGFSVSLAHAETFQGLTLSDDEGWKDNKGECATGVQYVFFKANNPLGKTSTWKRGARVKGNKIPPGTAIASFDDDGKYANYHAAILVEETKDGLIVWDQYKTPKKAWGKRTLYFSKDNNDHSNNGKLFYVIVK